MKTLEQAFIEFHNGAVMLTGEKPSAKDAWDAALDHLSKAAPVDYERDIKPALDKFLSEWQPKKKMPRYGIIAEFVLEQCQAMLAAREESIREHKQWFDDQCRLTMEFKEQLAARQKVAFQAQEMAKEMAAEIERLKEFRKQGEELLDNAYKEISNCDKTIAEQRALLVSCLCILGDVANDKVDLFTAEALEKKLTAALAKGEK